jgi:hypothetical protein
MPCAETVRAAPSIAAQSRPGFAFMNVQQGNQMKKIMRKLAVLSAIAALGGCATIIGSPTQTIPIQSTPSDASVVVLDETGTEVFKGSTPTTVTLQKSTGRYFGKKTFTVKLLKPGFQEQVIPVTSSANGWYVAGNFVFGGLIGWLVVDPLNGHMYTLSPDTVTASLSAGAASAPTTSHNNTGRDGSISIVLLENVPQNLRSEMKRIN